MAIQQEASCEDRARRAGWKISDKAEYEAVTGGLSIGQGTYFVKGEASAYATPATDEEAWRELCDIANLNNDLLTGGNNDND